MSSRTEVPDAGTGQKSVPAEQQRGFAWDGGTRRLRYDGRPVRDYLRKQADRQEAILAAFEAGRDPETGEWPESVPFPADFCDDAQIASQAVYQLNKPCKKASLGRRFRTIGVTSRIVCER